MSWADLTLAALSLTSLLLQGLMGVVNLLVEFKDSKGRITKWGRRALVVTLVSSTVALGTFIVEEYKRSQDAVVARARTTEQLRTSQTLLASAQKQQSDTNNLVHSTSRQLQSTQDVLARTDALLTHARTQARASNNVLLGVERVLTRIVGDAKVLLQVLNPKYPELEDTAAARKAVTGVEVRFRHRSSDKDDWIFGVGSAAGYMRAGPSVVPISSGPPVPLIYDTTDLGYLAMSVVGVAPALEQSFPSGRSLSVRDLRDGRFFVTLRGAFPPAACPGALVRLTVIAGAFPIELTDQRAEACGTYGATWSYRIREAEAKP